MGRRRGWEGVGLGGSICSQHPDVFFSSFFSSSHFVEVERGSHLCCGFSRTCTVQKSSHFLDKNNLVVVETRSDPLTDEII